MLMSTRLDYINEFKNKDAAIQDMSDLRKKFIELDDVLRDAFNDEKNPQVLRAISLARTKLEQSCMYAIKSLCLVHEKENA